MLRFAQPIYLWILLLVPLLWALFLYFRYRRRRNMATFLPMGYIPELVPDMSHRRPWVKIVLRSLAIVILALILARPQLGSRILTQHAEGVEIVLAVDVSNSMNARDVKPSRLAKTTMMLSTLVKELENDKVALVVYAGDAYMQVPLTSDYNTMKMFINTLNTQMVPLQGTNVSRAIEMSRKCLSPESNAGQAIILFTDAESHDGDAVAAAAEAAQANIRVNVVGVGTEKPTPIHTGSGNEYLKDRNGEIVLTQINEELGREIAKAGNGVYVRADNTNTALEVMVDEVHSMQSEEFVRRTYAEYNEQFPVLAWILLAILMIDALLLDRKHGWMSRTHIFTKKNK